MSETPTNKGFYPDPPRRADWTVPIFFGIIGAGLVVGFAAGYVARLFK